MNFAASKVPLGARVPKMYIYSVPAQETAKDRVKFCWPPVSDVAAVSNEGKTRNSLKFAGVPQTPERISAVSGPFRHTVRTCGEDIAVYQVFSDCRYIP